jgi:hypothetical protein
LHPAEFAQLAGDSGCSRLYDADQQDGVLDWRATRRQLYDHYVGSSSFADTAGGSNRRSSGYYRAGRSLWAGDFEQTVQIAVLSVSTPTATRLRPAG